MTTFAAPRIDSGLRSVRRRIRGASYLRKWVVLGALIGIVGGVGAIAFYTALELATRFFLGFLGGYTPPSPAGEGGAPITGFARAWALPLVVGLGGLISGIIVYRFAPEAEAMARTPRSPLITTTRAASEGGSRSSSSWRRRSRSGDGRWSDPGRSGLRSVMKRGPRSASWTHPTKRPLGHE